jgi:BirA family biotin operon repressor/biotin-[acetyl-CoA-carboxylase] ligase
VALFTSDNDVRAFAASLRTQHLGKQLDFRQRTGSTNDLALAAARAGAAHGVVFAAAAQDAGRGRRGRTWECPEGLGLLCSVLIRPEALLDKRAVAQNALLDKPAVARGEPAVAQGEIAAADLGWIPLATGLACTEALNDACDVTAALKWPNDVVLPCPARPGWRKLGGILCEGVLPAGAKLIERAGTPGSASGGYVVIGIGLNLNHGPSDLPEKAKAPPTSVLIETGMPCDGRAVFRAVLERLEERLSGFGEPSRRYALTRRIEAQLRQWWTPQRRLTIQTGHPEEMRAGMVSGSFEGLDDYGRLLLRDAAGNITVVADGEIVGVE